MGCHITFYNLVANTKEKQYYIECYISLFFIITCFCPSRYITENLLFNIQPFTTTTSEWQSLTFHEVLQSEEYQHQLLVLTLVCYIHISITILTKTTIMVPNNNNNMVAVMITIHQLCFHWKTIEQKKRTIII